MAPEVGPHVHQESSVDDATGHVEYLGSDPKASCNGIQVESRPHVYCMSVCQIEEKDYSWSHQGGTKGVKELVEDRGSVPRVLHLSGPL